MNKKVITTFVLNIFLIREVHSLVEFTNIKCESVDKDFMNFEYCRLKSVNRTYKYFSLKANLYQIPVTKVMVNPALYKRFSGYRPFLYNITLDACKFLDNPKANPIMGYLFDFINGRSNINHSCPYDHDIVLDRITTDFINHRLTKILPFPEGDYMVKVNWIAYDITRAVFQLYFSLS